MSKSINIEGDQSGKMIRRLHTLFQNISNLPLGRKILSLIFLSIFSTFLVSLFTINYVQTSANDLLYQVLAGSLNYSATDISSRLIDIESMASTIVSNKTVQKNLIAAHNTDNEIRIANSKNMLTVLIFDYYQTNRNNSLNYINLYTPKFMVSSYEPQITSLPDDIVESIIDASGKNSGYPCWITDYCNEYGLFLARDSRQVNQMKFNTLGTVIVAVDMDKLIKNSTQSVLLTDTTPYILYQGDKDIYHSKLLSDASAAEIKQQFKGPYCILETNNKKYFCVGGIIDSMSWDYICMIPYDSIARTILVSKILSIIILLIAAVALSLICKTIASSISKDFQRLIFKINEFEKNESEIPDTGYDYSRRTDEIGIIHNRFDHMAQRLRHLIQENYVNEILAKDAKLKALESQINPHFLYNTLESINWRAKAINEPQISEMVEALGSMLRSTISTQERLVTLQHELSIVHNYITIQKIRFDDMLSYEEEIPEKFLNLLLPQLTIQPLVENAIHYGMETNDEKCLIRIICHETGNDISIEIINNGSQFEDNLFEKLSSKSLSPKGFGIGLLNIQQRLQLTYGNGYGLFLFNLDDDHAVAQIRIPGEIYVKNTDC